MPKITPETDRANSNLLGFFVIRVLVTVRTVFFDFESPSGITTVFASGVTRDTLLAFVGIGATFSTFERNNISNAFLACHRSNCLLLEF